MNAPTTPHRKAVTAVDIAAACTFTDDQGVTWRGNLIAKARHADVHQLRLVRTDSGRLLWVPFERLNWEKTR